MQDSKGAAVKKREVGKMLGHYAGKRRGRTGVNLLIQQSIVPIGRIYEKIYFFVIFYAFYS